METIDRDNYQLLKGTFENALFKYTQKNHLSLVQEAKAFYFNQTGNIHEDDQDFESRMAGFNEWYILQFVPETGTRTLMQEYCEKEGVDADIALALTKNFRHSLYEYVGRGFRGNDRLRDLILRKKVGLAKDVPLPSLVKGDIFTGRVVNFRERNYLLEGIGTLPVDVKKVLKRQCKRIKKLDDSLEEGRFLLKVEGLKSKWKRYVNVDIEKIFQFD